MAKPRQKKLWSEGFQNFVARPFEWIQRDRYLEEFDSLPEEFPEGSLGERQFAYNPRTRIAKTVISETLSLDAEQADQGDS